MPTPSLVSEHHTPKNYRATTDFHLGEGVHSVR